MRYIFFILFIFCASSFAESLEIQQIDSAFVNGDYDKVELLSLRLLRASGSLPDAEKVHVNLQAGYALIMQNRESEAREYFYHALESEPTLVLDPIEVSPKFRVVFDEVRTDFEKTKQNSRPLAAESKTLFEPQRSGPSKTALLTNAVCPGIGQWQEGNPARGMAFFAATAGAVIWHISRLGELKDSRRAYFSETNADLIKSRYKDYNKDYQLAWYSGIAAAGVFVAAQVDLILFSGSKSENPLSSTNSVDLRMECAGSGTGVTTVGMKIRF